MEYESAMTSQMNKWDKDSFSQSRRVKWLNIIRNT